MAGLTAANIFPYPIRHCVTLSNARDDENLILCTSISDHHLLILLDFLVTVKAAPHECVIRTGQP